VSQKSKEKEKGDTAHPKDSGGKQKRPQQTWLREESFKTTFLLGVAINKFYEFQSDGCDGWRRSKVGMTEDRESSPFEDLVSRAIE